MALALQRSFDDLGTALADTEFCIFDLETTGGSPRESRITEIGAVKVRGGEVLGEFQTLVDPLVPIPSAITSLTGISDAMVSGQPTIDAALPQFLEFAGDAVLVAHSASFDVGFVRVAMADRGYPRLSNAVVCTVRLARRLVRDEVPNLRLATLANAMRARTQPCHRALDDARATTDVFHSLLELCGRWGVTHLDDLLWFQGARGHPSYRKVRLSDPLPRARGIYMFRDGTGRVLYVGKAANLRARVRSYFSDDRRHVSDLLREVERVDHLLCATDLEASVLEARMIRAHAPPFNRAQRGRAARWFLRLTPERFPRLVSSRTPGDGLGPLSSAASTAVREALEEAADLRTCTPRIGPKTRMPVCVRGQIGRCPAPCSGAVAPETYAAVVRPVERALAGDPSVALNALALRMERLAEQERFEEAASTRERLGALVEAIRTARAVRALRGAGRVCVDVDGSRIELDGGFLEHVDGRIPASPADDHPDEPRLVAAWLARNRARARLVSCDGILALEIAGGPETAEWAARIRTLKPVR